MRRVDIWPQLRRDQPVPCQWDASDSRRISFHDLFPSGEIHRAWEWSQHHELCKRQIGPLRNRHRSFEGLWPVARQSKDERTQNVHTMFTEKAQPIHQLLARIIEVFV